MEDKVIEYEAPFRANSDEEPVRERIDRNWMVETATAEHAKASDEHSSYFGCTYKENALRGIHRRAMAWFACEGNESERVVKGVGIGNEQFDGDLTCFFANVQANAYCKALQDGLGGEDALGVASEALYMVSEPYREWLFEWTEDIGS